MSEEEAVKRIAEAMRGNASGPEDKANVYAFLNAVAEAHNTTKTGYLRDDKELNEVGIPKLPVRTFHSLALISDKIMNNKFFKDYFETEAEVITKTSLSRNAKLLNLAVLQKIESTEKIGGLSGSGSGSNSSKTWFKSKSGGKKFSQSQPYGTDF